MEYITYESQCAFDAPTYCLYGSENAPSHCHVDFYEFSLFISGCYRNIYKNEETLCSTGHLTFYQPGESHELISSKQGSEHCSFIVRKDYFEEYYRKYWQSREYYDDISTLPQHISKELPVSQSMYLSQLASALAFKSSPEHQPISDQFLNALLFAICNTMPTGSMVGIEFYVHDLIRCFDACRYLETEISDLCAPFPVSQRALSDHFKATTGYSMMEYRNKRRMEYAAHLLQKENYSIATVSNMVNISCDSYFIKQFKKQFGITPKQYQLLHRKNETR